MRNTILIVLTLAAFALSAGCDDEEVIIGCRMYDHVFVENVIVDTLTTTNGTMKLFLAAGGDRELVAPVTFTTYSAGWLYDRIRVECHVYGLSYEKIPYPYCETVWMGDSLIIYYSGLPMSQYFFDCPSGLQTTPPCEPEWYRIDYATIYHPPGITVIAEEQPIGQYGFCDQAKEH